MKGDNDPSSGPGVSRRAVLFGGPISAALAASSEASAVGLAGLPPGSAQLFFYRSGTSAPAPVYAASSLTIEHPRPVIAASPASLPAIYLDEALAYRLVVRDASGSLIQDVDPVVPTRSGSRASGVIIVTPQQFGAVADDSGAFGNRRESDNYAAFMAAFAYLESLKFGPTSDEDYKSLPVLHIPSGLYYCSRTLELKAGAFTIEAPSGARIRFPPDTHGIIIHAYDTIGEGVQRTGPPRRASGSRITGLHVRGGGGTQAKHGIWLRTGAFIERCAIDNFPGDGVHIRGDVGGTDAGRGNANLFKLLNVGSFRNGRSGVYVQGGDTNAGYGIGLDVQYNGRWGIEDRSFLGNTWVACHADSNGLATAGPIASPNRVPSIVVHRKRLYVPRIGREAEANRTEPGTAGANGIWVPLSPRDDATPEIPQWRPGGAYAPGGSYAAVDPNARSTFVGCYEEGAQGPSQVNSPSLILGGFQGNIGTGARAFSHNGMFGATNIGSLDYNSAGESLEARFGGDPESNRLMQLFHSAHGEWWYNTTADYLQWNQFGAPAPVYRMTTRNTRERFGRATPYPHAFAPLRLIIGERLHSSIGSISDLNGADLARGDIFYYRDPVAAGKVGVVCTKAGRGGSTAELKEFGAIDP